VNDAPNSNGRKIAQLIGASWNLIAIGGALLSIIALGVSLRNTVERNQVAVAKQQEVIDALRFKVSVLETNQISPREAFEAIKEGRDRNRAQDDRITKMDERINKIVEALDRTYSEVQELRRQSPRQ
jgi:predicted RNase H-like nuclease (RuvC/YqgF family)